MIKAVLFDLDGTLLDSAPDLVGALNYLRSGLDLAPVPVADLRHFVSQGAVGLIRAGMPPCDEQTLKQWREKFLEYYASHSFEHSRPFDGIETLLSRLQINGIGWGIVTNKMESLTFPIVEMAGWSASARSVICGDTLSHSKPHPAPVLAACRQMDVDPGHTIMIGDDQRDIEAGLRAGCQTALAMYGYSVSEVEAEILEQTTLVHSPDEIQNLLGVLKAAS